MYRTLQEQEALQQRLGVLQKDQPLRTQKHIDFILNNILGKDEQHYEDCMIPAKMSAYNTNMMWVCYWSTAALTSLHGGIDGLRKASNTDKHIQIFIARIAATIEGCIRPGGAGFAGNPRKLYAAHLASTYAALSTIRMLPYIEGLQSLVNMEAIIKLIRKLRRPSSNGSTCAIAMYENSAEEDMRAIYCAVASAHLSGLTDPSIWAELFEGVPQHIRACQNDLEGGIAGSYTQTDQPCANEAHAGYTYCGLAAYRILEQWMPNIAENPETKLDEPALRQYIASRQQISIGSGGCNGRTNKLVDGCYSFWVGAAASLFPESLAVDSVELSRFVHNVCQPEDESLGGLRDKPGKSCDLYHTCYCLLGLNAISGDNNFDARLGIFCTS